MDLVIGIYTPEIRTHHNCVLAGTDDPEHSALRPIVGRVGAPATDMEEDGSRYGKALVSMLSTQAERLLIPHKDRPKGGPPSVHDSLRSERGFDDL